MSTNYTNNTNKAARLSLSNSIGQSRFLNLNTKMDYPVKPDNDKRKSGNDPSTLLDNNIRSKPFRAGNRKSFTLIELLVVLALVAILSVVVVMTLNPAELLKQARDSNRLSDLSTINTALNLFSADVTGGFMGTSTVIYVSIPDTSATCANLGLPLLPTSSYTYNCVTTANLRNTDGTGWIPVNFQQISSNSPLSQLPIDPTNTTTSLNYYTYMTGGSWKLTAISLESQKYIAEGLKDGGTAPSSYELGNNLTLGQTVFPNGWIKVPGDSRFGTSDFWVMKYEAKCADSSGNLLISPTDGAYQIYHAGTTPCTSASDRYVTSAPTGYPIANISQTNSHIYCQSIGARLITNNEWQTISWNIQNNENNWSSGVVGTGYVYSGHNDNAPGIAIMASSDDNNGYANTGNTSGNQKRTHILSNGQTIWDLAGNVWEWTNDTITGANQPTGATPGFTFRQFTAITTWGTMTQQTAGPANSSWNSTQGIGQIYSDGTGSNSTNYAFIRGGNRSDYGYAGVGALAINNGLASASYYIGFRCAR